MKTAARAKTFPGISVWGPERLQLRSLLSALKLAPGGETLTGRENSWGIDNEISKPVTGELHAVDHRIHQIECFHDETFGTEQHGNIDPS